MTLSLCHLLFTDCIYICLEKLRLIRTAIIYAGLYIYTKAKRSCKGQFALSRLFAESSGTINPWADSTAVPSAKLNCRPRVTVTLHYGHRCSLNFYEYIDLKDTVDYCILNINN